MVFLVGFIAHYMCCSNALRAYLMQRILRSVASPLRFSVQIRRHPRPKDILQKEASRSQAGHCHPVPQPVRYPTTDTCANPASTIMF